MGQARQRKQVVPAPNVTVNDQVTWQGVYGKVAGEDDDNLMGTPVERKGTVLIIDKGAAVVQTKTVNGEPFKGGTLVESLTRTK